MRDIKPRAAGRKLTWRGFCAPFSDAPELNDDKQAGIRYDVRAISVKLTNAAYVLETCPADALAHLLPSLLSLVGDDAASELRSILLDAMGPLAPSGMLCADWSVVTTAIRMAAFLKPFETGIACATVLDQLAAEPVAIVRLRSGLSALEDASCAAMSSYLKGWAGDMLVLRDAVVLSASPPLTSPLLAAPTAPRPVNPPSSPTVRRLQQSGRRSLSSRSRYHRPSSSRSVAGPTRPVPCLGPTDLATNKQPLIGNPNMAGGAVGLAGPDARTEIGGGGHARSDGDVRRLQPDRAARHPRAGLHGQAVGSDGRGDHSQ